MERNSTKSPVEMEKTQKHKDWFYHPESSWCTRSLRLELQGGLRHLIPMKSMGWFGIAQGNGRSQAQIQICWWLVRVRLFGCLDPSFIKPKRL